MLRVVNFAGAIHKSPPKLGHYPVPAGCNNIAVWLTVSASIPAAVMSMAILRGVFKTGSILENNIVQTLGSTGESLAAGVIFTIPALVFLGMKL